ncbi:hypothetical protein, partial [Sinorhizobium meliloti]|uniref:hypothetical protein n=1 Tax=Rhizobium meliloti TaxID=382 RepID=UPI001AECA95C
CLLNTTHRIWSFGFDDNIPNLGVARSNRAGITNICNSLDEFLPLNFMRHAFTNITSISRRCPDVSGNSLAHDWRMTAHENSKKVGSSAHVRGALGVNDHASPKTLASY